MDAMQAAYVPGIILVSAGQSAAIFLRSDNVMSQIGGLVVRKQFEPNSTEPVLILTSE